MSGKAIITALVISAPAYAQGYEALERLRYENQMLGHQVDSLKIELRKLSGGKVIDTWENLNGLWEGDGQSDILASLEADGMSQEDSEIFGRIVEMTPTMRVPWNPTLKRHIEHYAEGPRRKRMPEIIARYEKYYPQFKAVFDMYGIPEEIIPLCIVESAISPRAVSKMGAVGVWQFMPETARDYGLRVDGLVDERMSIYKSTVAAARYLENAYKRFGRWDLAVLSYNCGAGNINKAIIRSRGDMNLWTIYEFLPDETKGYLPSLLAAGYVVRYSGELGIERKQVSRQVESAVVITKTSTFKEVAAVGKISVASLKRANPHFLTEILPQGCVLMVPAGTYKEINAMFR